MKSCMVEDIKNDKLEVIDEVFDLFGKLKWNKIWNYYNCIYYYAFNVFKYVMNT
jgi:hypothetical protein